MQMSNWNSELGPGGALPLWLFLAPVLRDTIIKPKVKRHGQLAEPLLLQSENILHLEKEGMGELGRTGASEADRDRPLLLWLL